jgi:hypothetical protein
LALSRSGVWIARWSFFTSAFAATIWSNGNWHFVIAVFVACIFLAVTGFATKCSRRASYHVILNTSGGERIAANSPDKSFIQRFTQAIEAARPP